VNTMCVDVTNASQKVSRLGRRPSMSRHPKTLQVMDRAGVLAPGERQAGGATGCGETWTATWEEQEWSDRDARCAVAVSHPQHSAWI